MRTLKSKLKTLALGLMAVSSSFSMAGDSSKTAHYERTQLTLADFRMLLKGEKKNVLGSELVAGLSDEEKLRLSGKIAKLEKERAQKIELEKKEARKSKSAIKNDRKEIQRKRLNSSGSDDAGLKESLFSSLLDEANTDARLAKRVQEIEQSYLVSVFYSMMDSRTKLEMIALEDNSAVWTQSANFESVASK